jgi:hypothetical protein
MIGVTEKAKGFHKFRRYFKVERLVKPERKYMQNKNY